jgi:hypothetical protein
MTPERLAELKIRAENWKNNRRGNSPPDAFDAADLIAEVERLKAENAELQLISDASDATNEFASSLKAENERLRGLILQAQTRCGADDPDCDCYRCRVSREFAAALAESQAETNRLTIDEWEGIGFLVGTRGRVVVLQNRKTGEQREIEWKEFVAMRAESPADEVKP